MSDRNRLTPQIVLDGYSSYKAEKRGRSGGSVASSNWPTALAHRCRAYAFWNRHVPGDRRRAISADLSMLFDEGNAQELIVRHDLENAGFEITENQTQMTWPQYQISGRKDFKISKEGFGDRINCDLKTAGDYTFRKINTPADCLNSDWFASWYRQIALYMFLAGVNEYWIVLKSKNLGKLKIIPFVMDEQIEKVAEEMVQKAEWVNKLVQIGELPKGEDKISDADVCSDCQFFDTCLPDLSFGPGAIIFTEEESAELIAQLDRRAEIEALAKEFKHLDDQLKDEMKSHASEGQTSIVIGPWIATLKDGGRAAYSVKACTFKTVKFVRQGE